MGDCRHLEAAGFGMALLTTTIQGFTANASTPTDATETNGSIAPRSNNNAIILAEKPFLVEHGKTVACNANQSDTHTDITCWKWDNNCCPTLQKL